MTATVHPGSEQLAAFVHGQLPSELRNEVVRHLLRGCSQCCREVAAVASPIFDPSQRLCPAGGDAAYEFPVRRAFYSMERRAIALESASARAELEIGALYARGELPPETAEAASQPLLFARAEAWLRHAKVLRQSDAASMEVAAAVGLVISEGLEARQHPAGSVCDLQAQLWAEVGYARRLKGDFVGGSSALGRAVRLAARGTGDLHLLTKIAEIVSSHRVAERQFDDSQRILSLVLTAYIELSDRQQAGKALILMGLTAGYAGETEEAIAHFSSALNWLNRPDGAHDASHASAPRDPRLLFSAIHNLLWFSAELGRFELVGRLATKCREIYREVATPLERIKLLWICGRQAMSLGELGSAAFRLREVRRSFEERGMPYLTALVSLDLGIVLLEQGSAHEALALVEETLAAFSALGITRESLATLVLLAHALEQERATAALFRRAAAEVKRLEAAPVVGKSTA